MNLLRASTEKCNFVSTAMVTLVAVVIVFSSCEKDNFFSNFKSAGPVTSVERTLGPAVDHIILNDDVNLVITQGTTPVLQLEGGKNLLANIETTIDSNKLIISNINKFNWLRSYENKITAYVTLPVLSQLTYNSTGRVTTTDTIHINDSVDIEAIGGSGYIDLVLNSAKTKLSIFKGCSVDMKVAGRSGLTFIFAAGYGPFYCENLHSDFVFMRSISTNFCRVYASSKLEYELMNIGDIIYYGNPVSLSGSITGKGKLIKGD